MMYGQPFMGTDQGPRSLREAGLHEAIKKLGWWVDEQGDLDLKGSQADFGWFRVPPFSLSFAVVCSSLSSLIFWCCVY